MWLGCRQLDVVVLNAYPWMLSYVLAFLYLYLRQLSSVLYIRGKVSLGSMVSHSDEVKFRIKGTEIPIDTVMVIVTFVWALIMSLGTRGVESVLTNYNIFNRAS